MQADCCPGLVQPLRQRQRGDGFDEVHPCKLADRGSDRMWVESGASGCFKEAASHGVYDEAVGQKVMRHRL